MKTVSQSEEDDIYKIQIANDLQDREPKLKNNKFRKNWFYFKVVNMNPEEKRITVAITNLLTKQFLKIWKNNSDIYIKVRDC
jgi:hypothetical protein